MNFAFFHNYQFLLLILRIYDHYFMNCNQLNFEFDFSKYFHLNLFLEFLIFFFSYKTEIMIIEDIILPIFDIL